MKRHSVSFRFVVVTIFLLAISWLFLGWAPSWTSPRPTFLIPNAFATGTSTFNDFAAYRWYTNLNSSTVGTPYVNSNTLMTAPAQGTPFRLRFLLHTSSSFDYPNMVTTSAIETANDVGKYSSMVAPTTSTLYVIHYDATNADLRFDKSTNAGATWTTSSIDTSGDVGSYASLSSVGTSSLFAVHYEATNSGKLRFASSSNGGTNWATSTIDSTGNPGQYAAISAWSTSTLYVAYEAATAVDLRFAKSTNGGVTWTTSTVDSAGNVGTYNSIAVPASTSSYIYISYYDSSNNDLRFASSSNGGTNWGTSTITSVGTVGQYTSITAPTTSTLYISYENVTASKLEFAKSTNGGGTWATSSVDSVAAQYTSIASVGTSTIFITYFDSGSNNMKMAASADGGTTWRTQVVDSSATNVGQYTSVAAADADHIYASYYDGNTSNRDLKFIKSPVYKLQYAQQSGTCDSSFTGETYNDVATSTGDIRYYDNSTPSDGDFLGATGTDPTYGADTVLKLNYKESNPFKSPATSTAFSSGNDGEWDASLVDFSAPSSTSYCFRVIRDDGTLLASHTKVPEILTASRTYTQAAYRIFSNIDSADLNASVSNPSSSADIALAIAVDSSGGFYYTVGYDGSPGNNEWRLEKRSIATSSLLYATTSNPTANDDEPVSIALNTASGTMVIGGYKSVSASNKAWYYEVRNTSDGSVIYSTSTDPSSNNDLIQGVAVNAASGTMYLAGYDSVQGSTDAEWRIEAHTMSTGALLYTATSSPSTGMDLASAIGVDAPNNAIYVAGYDNNTAGRNAQERLEKRTASTGALAYSTTTDPTANGDGFNSIALDATNSVMYLGGRENETGFGFQRNRVEKRNFSDGGLSYAATSVPALTGNIVNGIVTDGSYLYAGSGPLLVAGQNEMFYEKRSSSTGALSFSTTSYPLVNNGIVNGMGIDVTNGAFYGAGTDYNLGNNAWRVEKYNTSDGGQAWGTGLAATNATTTAPVAGTPFRLRMLLRVSGSQLATSTDAFKLQVAQQSGTCDTAFSGESYADVTSTSGAIRFYDNPTPSNNDTLYPSPFDPTDGGNTVTTQSYVELNNATTSRTVAVGADGEWDYSLVVDSSASASTSYCFRTVRSDGTTSTITYSVIPEVVTRGAATLTQSAYRFYSNANGTSTGAVLAAQDATATTPSEGTPFRLKLLIQASGNTVAQNGRTLKLQFATINGTCAASSYSDIATSTGVLQYYNNSTPTDGTTIAASSSDPTYSTDIIVPQTYEEQNTFSNGTAAIYSNQDGLWDFALVDQGMTSGVNYCIRAVDTSGAVLDSYVQYPTLIKGGPASASVAPTYTNVGTSTLTVNLTSVSGASFYRFERSTDGNSFSEITTSTSLTYGDSGIASTTTYYYRYRASDGTTNGGYSPSSSVSTLTGFTSGTLMSVIIDTAVTNGVAPNSIFWEGSAPTGTTVKFQFAAATSTAGPWTSSDFVAWSGTACSSSSYYTPSGPSVPVEVKALCHQNKRYLRYEVYVSTTNPSVTPSVDRVILNYAR